jgi:hypothetical protein
MVRRGNNSHTVMLKLIESHNVLPVAATFAGGLPCRQEPGNAYASDRVLALARRCAR